MSRHNGSVWFRLLPAAAIVILLTGCVHTVRTKDLFHPRKYPVMSDVLERKNVSIRVDEHTVLRGWFIGRKEYRRSVIYLYGNGETAVDIAPLLYGLSEALEANFLTVDYRGYGASDGTPDMVPIACSNLASATSERR